MRGVLAAMCAAVWGLHGWAAASAPYVESEPAELARSIPELAGLRVQAAPERLDLVLRGMAEAYAAMAAGAPEMSFVEEIHEMRFEEGGMLAASRREQARYAMAWAGGRWREARTGLAEGGPTGFFVTAGFLESLRFLLPGSVGETRFLYLGRMTEGGREAEVLAFLRPAGAAHQQGLVWMDQETKRLLRVRLSMLDRIEGVALESWSSDIRLVRVEAAGGGVMWAPGVVTVEAGLPGRELLTVHRFGEHWQKALAMEEPLELIANGIELTHRSEAAAGVKPLRLAREKAPERLAVRFHLGAALAGAGDLVAAEGELRAVVQALPESVAARNSLGVVLYQRGDIAGAVAEFQECLRLQPRDMMARENLAKAQAAQVAQVAGETIRVDVRQVMVPVVVVGGDGHFATALKQSDFQILEDGVEQRITSFAVESSGLQMGAKAVGAGQPAAAQGAPAARRTYLICVDTLHSSLSTFNQVRQSLIKLLRAEKKGDSQYALIALGTGATIVQNMTPDPEVVLRAVEDRGFQKLFQGSRASSAAAELERFERVLAETRMLCDNREPLCGTKRATLPSVAAEIGEADRVQTMTFLRQLSSLVEQMGRAGQRRTMVLISTGFQMTPGRDAHELLSAYFPEIRGVQLRTMERMQDALEPVFRLAAKLNVPIHTIDSRGLYTSSYQESSRSSGGGRVGPAVERALNRNADEAGATLQEIASATGGTAFRNNNDLFAGLTRAFADGRDYYMLSYVSSNAAADGKFRAITVKLRDSKLVVHAKRGYWAAGP